MRYGVVGNREGFTYAYVKSRLDEMGVCNKDIIISGGAMGVDSFAEQYAKEKGCQLVVHKPDLTKPSPERYFERNKKIVHDSDIIFAFNKKERSGTTNTINYAYKNNKKVKVFDELTNTQELSLCGYCNCMTYVLMDTDGNRFCGKCKSKKRG